MESTKVALVKTDVTPEELALLVKFRNKRDHSYNLRVSDKELQYLDTIQKEVEATGTKFEGRTDFVVHCAQTVATIAKSQTKLL